MKHAPRQQHLVEIQKQCLSHYSYVDLSVKNAAGYRGECGTVSGASVPCIATDPSNKSLNYSVDQGSSLAVTFQGAAKSYVFLGGALNDQFTNDAQTCYLSTTTTPAYAHSITTLSDSGFVFSPTGAVCSQFVNNTIGSLTVLAFDANPKTSSAESSSGSTVQMLGIALLGAVVALTLVH
ncbi:hypothetical protein WJX73_010346 [Symbiochloris irregularis]|uniref:Uncharacterized protein n=1 Tax=Symbiochloris irregularis TaxID=706552 RepID=A0AAW1PYD8_9CHLO